MNKLRVQFDTTKLDELCNSLTQEIAQLATSDYKLKLMFVLVHIIGECQKALGDIDTTNLLNDLKALVGNACDKTKKQKEALDTWYSQDKTIKEIIDGTNDEISIIEQKITELLKQYDEHLKKMVELREKLDLPEIVN